MNCFHRTVNVFFFYGLTCILFGAVYTVITFGLIAAIVYYKTHKEDEE